MASSSSPSSSRSPQNKRISSFRPQFPVDPFGASTLAPRPSSSISYSLSEPWLLKPDQIPSSTAYRRDVVLVLGSKSSAHSPTLISAHHSFPFQLPQRNPSQRCLLLNLSSARLLYSLPITHQPSHPILSRPFASYVSPLHWLSKPPVPLGSSVHLNGPNALLVSGEPPVLMAQKSPTTTRQQRTPLDRSRATLSFRRALSKALARSPAGR